MLPNVRLWPRPETILTKPYEFIGVGAMAVTKPYEFIGFGAMEVTKPYEFTGVGTVDPDRAYPGPGTRVYRDTGICAGYTQDPDTRATPGTRVYPGPGTSAYWQ